MSENSDKYRRAVQGFSVVLDKVPNDAWSNPSPCEGWTAKSVVDHLINGTKAITQVSGGPGPDRTDPAELAGDDPAAKYRQARDAALALLTEENLGTKVNGPMGEMPLDQLIGMFLTTDVLIHTWDLAKAADIDVTLDPQLVEETYNALQPIDAMIRMPGVFGPKVEPPAGADAQTTLMCFCGRKA